MDLQFWPGAVVMMLIATLTASLVTNSGRSAWFVGVLVLMVYLIFAMTLYLLPPQVAVDERPVQARPAVTRRGTGMAETLNTLLKISLVIFMAGNLLDMGLRLRLGTALVGLRDVRFVSLSLLWCFVLGPAIAWGSPG
ncbi:MAG: hypothetical protein MZW92_02040 [Comamonadaceae bacterium]|nr:hypothetical protein [Comamonadaceae bacterium]